MNFKRIYKLRWYHRYENIDLTFEDERLAYSGHIFKCFAERLAESILIRSLTISTHPADPLPGG